jgi:(R,R)-butanediol dehydrogenase/meso-butanediol dehydrogenase/diacetyl reductase
VELGAGTQDHWREGQRVVALPYIGCGRCAHCLAGQPVWCAKVRSHANGGVCGGFAQYVVVGASESLLMPDALSWEHGALIEPLAVGMHAVDAACLAPGANILVIGAGPVGLAVVACARALGARNIIVTARSTQRATIALAMGATEFLPNDKNLSKAFQAIAGGRPDAVFECVGQPGAIDLSVKLAAPNSTVVVMGACMAADTFRPLIATNKALRLQFVLAYGRRDFEIATDFLARGRIDPSVMISERVGFEAFPQAFEALRERSTQCKVLLAPDM